MHRISALALSLLLAVTAAAADALPPFGAGSKVPPRTLKPGAAVDVPIDCLSAARAALWTVENPRAGLEAPPFAIAPVEGADALRLYADRCDPGRTTVRILLPGDAGANGKAWSKARATQVSLLCKASAAAELSLHLLVRGKPAGTHQAAFAVQPGDWQRIILPVADFDLTSFGSVAGLGFRITAAAAGAEVLVRGVSACSLPLSDDAWKSHRLQIGLDGDWRFASDPGDRGLAQGWSARDCDDAGWRILASGRSWQEQGVDAAGYGWYRQRLFVPKECAGMPLRLELGTIASDDDAWFNGERIGGIGGEYKYDNWLTRSYTVPAALVRYGEENQIAVRIWGGNLSFIGDKSGLAKGPLTAEFDPYAVLMRDPGGTAVAAELYDLSAAQRGKPFEIIVPFPAEVAAPGTTLVYAVGGAGGDRIVSGRTPLLAAEGGTAQAVIAMAAPAAQQAYLRGRLRLTLQLVDAAGTPLYVGARSLDRLRFAARDALRLPPLAETWEDTALGRLRLVDEIDAATPVGEDAHPYVQSGFSHDQSRMPPGSPVDVQVHSILGRGARECGYGWFAYRIGRGALKPRSTYLLRIEYPEDKPRFAPIEIQTGQNYMDVGWKNGVGADDVYDNWPLSGGWQWYDVIVALDDETMGMGGTGAAPAENGFWVYFMNKQKPGAYYSMYAGGPAVGRMRLYELDPERNAPAIRRPSGLPNRVLSLDWERQPDGEPSDLVAYAKLMGYSAISPVIIKWAFANYSEPLNGYHTVNIDARNYWTRRSYDPKAGLPAAPPVPGKPSVHQRYLDATRGQGIDYIPRVEWGGSMDLPEDAWAIDEDGKQAKPNRFATWCGNLLKPAAWDDLERLMRHLVGAHAAANPQLKGVHWRIRSDRLPISYGREDLALFAQETGTALPPGGYEQRAAWAAREGKERYDAWWHRKRADLHIRLSRLLTGWRPDMTLYYFNWDTDKFGIIDPDITAWAFVSSVVKPGPEGGRAAYLRDRRQRASYTAEDYIAVMRTGNFGAASKGVNRADYGLRPELYREAPGIQLFAPANYLCYADKPAYLEYFRTGDGVAVSNVVSYDEIGARSINPKYEGNMILPAGPAFSMALELLSYFHSDARTLAYTVYTYGRGFAAAHRRFAQAYLALPAIPGTVVDQGDPEVKVRTYASANGTYVGVASRGHAARRLSVTIPAAAGATVTDLVSGRTVEAQRTAAGLRFAIDAGPMQLDAFLVTP
ncbi:MAG: hypothetical protein J0M02_12000 [Planctomycetes bacterium]|nr:hypothetical protein [Planctomycetota bacterium]